MQDLAGIVRTVVYALAKILMQTRYITIMHRINLYEVAYIYNILLMFNSVFRYISAKYDTAR